MSDRPKKGSGVEIIFPTPQIQDTTQILRDFTLTTQAIEQARLAVLTSIPVIDTSQIQKWVTALDLKPTFDAIAFSQQRMLDDVLSSMRGLTALSYPVAPRLPSAHPKPVVSPSGTPAPPTSIHSKSLPVLPSKPQKDLTETEAHAIVAARLARGERLTAKKIMQLTGYTHSGATRLIGGIARVLPIRDEKTYSHETGRWVIVWFLDQTFLN